MNERELMLVKAVGDEWGASRERIRTPMGRGLFTCTLTAAHSRQRTR